MKNWLLILLCFGFITGCSSGGDTDPCDAIECGTDQYCDDITVQCIDYRCSEDHPTGSCTELTQQCIAGSCVDRPCSPEYIDGPCDDPKEYCMQGVCTAFPCSADNRDGVCDDGHTCYLGTCRAVTCSQDKIDGLCPEGLKCVAGSCIAPPCSLDDLDGFCELGKTCMRGACVVNDLLCSSARTDGLCPYGQRCGGGECVVTDCGDNNPDGTCASGRYCAATWSSEFKKYQFSCEKITCSNTELEGACIPGKICQQGRCVIDHCNGLCGAREICDNGICKQASFYCSNESPNGWCGVGENCYRGVCRLGTDSPCDQQVCPDRESCLMTGGLAICTPWEEQCSGENQSGQCDDGMSCLGGRCLFTKDDPCKDIICDEGKICHPESGLCYESRCSGAIRCPEDTNKPVDPNMICVNDFKDAKGYRCICESGMIYNPLLGQCEEGLNPCSEINCGVGYCQVNGDQFQCVCDEGAQNRTFGGDDICVYPESYPYCDDIQCGSGVCRIAEIIIDQQLVRYPVCDCFGATIFDPVQMKCVIGNQCGDDYCEPGRSACVVVDQDRYCDVKACSSAYPSGSCFGAGNCINGICVPEVCSIKHPNGYCPDQYLCNNGACCRNGVCHNLSPDLKPYGSVCDPTLNECLSDGICLPDPAGIHRCYELCSQDDPCLDRQDSCITGGISFKGLSVDGVGICLEDQNCIENSCSQFQTCLFYQQSGISGCFEKGTVVTGGICGELMQCGVNDICLNERCVNRCGSGSDPLCFDEISYQAILTGQINHYDALPFNHATDPDNIIYCSDTTLCDIGTCLKLWDEVGFCVTECDPTGVPFSDQCGSGDICYTINDSGVCLPQSDCSVVTQYGCDDDQICYPVTDQLNGCVAYGTQQPGEVCDFQSLLCQRGHCIDGICNLLCDKADGCIDPALSCVDTDSFYNQNELFTGTPYGVCE